MRAGKPMHVIAPSLQSLIVPITALEADPDNARTHGERALASAKRSLAQFGQQKPVVRLPGGRVIAGNGIYLAARALGWTALAAVTFIGDRHRARAFAIADNRTAEASEWDRQRLARELGALTTSGIDPLAVGFTAPELRALAALVATPDADTEPALSTTDPGGSVTLTLEFNTLTDHADFTAFIARRKAGDADLLTTGQALARYLDQLVTP